MVEFVADETVEDKGFEMEVRDELICGWWLKKGLTPGSEWVSVYF